MVQRAGAEIHEWVKRRWKEDEWEAAWFVNPPVGSVPGLRCVGSDTHSKCNSYRGCRAFLD